MATITQASGSTAITTAGFMTQNNANLVNLNTDKIETSVLDNDTTLSANSDLKVATQKAVKAYVDAGGNVNASETNKGIVEASTQAEMDAQTDTGATGALLLTVPSKMHPKYPETIFSAVYGDTGSSIFWVNSSNERTVRSGSKLIGYVNLLTGAWLSRDLVTDWAQCDEAGAHFVVLGVYLYVWAKDVGTSPHTCRVYRFLKTDLAAGGTLMTFSGAVVLTNTNSSVAMTTDGTSFYFNFEAGSSANDYLIAKYTLSGTNFAYVSTITCGVVANCLNTIQVRAADGHIIGWGTLDNKLRRYNTSGTIQSTSPFGFAGGFSSINGVAFYGGIANNSSDTYLIKQRVPIL